MVIINDGPIVRVAYTGRLQHTIHLFNTYFMSTSNNRAKIMNACLLVTDLCIGPTSPGAHIIFWAYCAPIMHSYFDRQVSISTLG